MIAMQTDEKINLEIKNIMPIFALRKTSKTNKRKDYGRNSKNSRRYLRK